MPQGDKIAVEELLSNDIKLFDTYINKIEALDKTYEAFIDTAIRGNSKLERANQDLIQRVSKLEDQLKEVNVTFKEQQDLSVKVANTINEEAQQFENLTASQKENADIIDKLTKEKEELTDAAKELIKIQQQNVKLQDRLNGLDTESAKKQAEVKLAIQERNKELKEQAKESAGLITQYDKESKRLETLRKAYKGVAAQFGVNSNEAKELIDEVTELDKKLKDIDESAGQSQRKVGSYADALRDAGGASSIAVDGVRSLGASFKALLANPVVLVISLIVAGLVALFNQFKKTSFGAELLAKGGALIDGILSSLVGIVDKLRIGLQSVFEDPLGALEDLGKAILTNIVNRFQAIPKLLQLAGKSFKQLIDRDFKGLTESAKEAGQAFIQLQTGLDETQQANLAKGFSNLTKEVSDNVKAFVALEEARQRVRKENRQLELSVENLITQEEKLLSIRDDATKSFAEREAAQELSAQKQEQRFSQQLQISKNNLDLINEEVRLRKANGEAIQDLLDEQLETYKSFIQAEREFTLAVRENEKERDQLKQDRLERDLDILIDGFDNQKTINERVIADERKLLADRRRIFENTRKLSDDSFAKQIETIQQFTGVAINANDLIAESDAVTLNQKIRALGLSEIIEGRLLEVVRERRIVAQDLADIERDLADAENERALRLREVTQADLDRFVARKELEADFSRFSFTSINERVQAEINSERFKAETLLQDETLLAEEKARIRKDSEDKITEIQRKGFEDRQALIEQEVEQFFAFANELGNLFGALSARRSMQEDERLERLEEQKQQELTAAEGNAREQQAIERRFDREKEKIEREQARRARRLALFQKGLAVSQSIIDTAAAVTAALRNPPGPPFSIPQAIAAGIFGGVRTAAIIAQPVPQFYKGTKHSPFGKAIVAEIGPELIEKPGGKMELANKPQMVDLPGGSKVFNHVFTNNVLEKARQNAIADGIISGNNNQNRELIKLNPSQSKLVSSLISNQKEQNESIKKSFDNAISNLPEIHQWNTKNGDFSKNVRKGTTVYLDVQDENDY